METYKFGKNGELKHLEFWKNGKLKNGKNWTVWYHNGTIWYLGRGGARRCWDAKTFSDF